MEQFLNDILSIYTLINKNNTTNTTNTSNKKIDIIQTAILSKQYLTYYLYRIIAKFMPLISIALPSKDITKLFKLLLIPREHDINKNYPLVGKMTYNEQTLDLIIKLILEMLSNLDKYINTLPNKDSYKMLYIFLETKNLSTIIQDIQDLQTLLPGISVKSSRFNYIIDKKL